jgi:hypothetical protein
MQKVIRKPHEAVNWTTKIMQLVGKLPIAMAGLALALTSLWVAAIFWFLFNWLLWRILY